MLISVQQEILAKTTTKIEIEVGSPDKNLNVDYSPVSIDKQLINLKKVVFYFLFLPLNTEPRKQCI